MTALLNTLNAIAGLLLATGVYLEFGLGWSLITGGLYLAYNVISTVKVLNVRN